MLTLDLETAGQLRYVDPAAGVAWDEDSLRVELSPDAQDFDTEELYNEAMAAWIDPGKVIRSGQAIVKATGVVPALHPTTHHIVAASFGGVDKMRGSSVDVKTLADFGTSNDYATLIEEGAEAKLVETCLDRVAWATKDKPPLVTFNGKGADLWWLLIRAIILGVEPTAPARSKINWRDVFYPYSNHPHLDLRLFLGNGNRFAKGTLSWWADALGVESEESGAEVWGMVQRGEWEVLKRYGVREGHTLLELYERIKQWA